MTEFMDDSLDIIRKQMLEITRYSAWGRKTQISLLATQQALSVAWGFLTPEQREEVADAHNQVLVLLDPERD